MQAPNLNPNWSYDVEAIRRDFPILARQVYGKPLVFLDNAASAQKPRQVIQSMVAMMEGDYANVHRGVHYLSQRATDLYEGARERVRRFIGAKSVKEIVFTRGATEAINLVAASWGRTNLEPGDEIVITGLEHHSNIVPWQMLRDERRLKLTVVPLRPDGSVDPDDFARALTDRTKLAAFAHMSNSLGTVLPVAEMIRIAHGRGVTVLVDGCQAVPHMPVDVQALDADFYVFSSHKVYGPTGIGVLYGKRALLDRMPPYQGGGDMISTVTFEKSTWAALPAKFEAGTPAIVEAVGLAAALDYVEAVGLERIAAHETDLLDYATAELAKIPGLQIIGTAPVKGSIVSFALEGVHPHDVGTIVDRAGVAVRAGHHCAQPVMEFFGVPATARASFAMYNTRAEVDALAAAIGEVQEMFSR
ncbi:MAG TPA: cysteine desulfurase [Alphaproteobacteria bacterium]|nr:cysteine desulfurase [Alphaproteobacteria bacterium]